jgi:hypothetical protein
MVGKNITKYLRKEAVTVDGALEYPVIIGLDGSIIDYKIDTDGKIIIAEPAEEIVIEKEVIETVAEPEVVAEVKEICIEPVAEVKEKCAEPVAEVAEVIEQACTIEPAVEEKEKTAVSGESVIIEDKSATIEAIVEKVCEEQAVVESECTEKVHEVLPSVSGEVAEVEPIVKALEEVVVCSEALEIPIVCEECAEANTTCVCDEVEK